MDNSNFDDTDDISTFWKRENCIYTSCFCEENIWKLCNKAKNEGKNLDNYYVIFLTNKIKKFPIWSARKINNDNKQDFIVWDYHVILLWLNKINTTKSLIFDFDTELSFPCLIEL